MDGPYDMTPPAWNPAIEAWPGGPHPGAVLSMEEERAARALEGERAVARREEDDDLIDLMLLLK